MRTWKVKNRPLMTCVRPYLERSVWHCCRYRAIHADATAGRCATVPNVTTDHRNLAERLGLYAPFRHMEAAQIAEDTALPLNADRRQKRRRTSSETSCLEPAVIKKSHKPRKYGEEKHHNRHRPIRRHGDDSDVIEVYSDTDKSSASVASSLVRPSRTYMRRSRHKTKDDKYNVHQEKIARQKKEKKKRARTKHRHRERSGTALLQNFSANNVAQDRLTVST